MKKYKFTINEKDYNVVVKDISDDIAELEVNGAPVSVKVHMPEVKAPKTPILVRKEVQNKPGENKVAEKLAPMPLAAKPSAKTINAPLPGNVLKVLVSEGDVIKEGDTLLIMESMKMENNILAEKGGTIVKVLVTAGTAAMQDQPLFEIQ